MTSNGYLLYAHSLRSLAYDEMWEKLKIANGADWNWTKVMESIALIQITHAISNSCLELLWLILDLSFKIYMLHMSLYVYLAMSNKGQSSWTKTFPNHEGSVSIGRIQGSYHRNVWKNLAVPSSETILFPLEKITYTAIIKINTFMFHTVPRRRFTKQII